MSAVTSPAAIAVMLLFVLALAVLAVREYAEGVAQNRAVTVRSALDDVEARASRLDVRADVWLRRRRVGQYLERRLAAAGVPMLTSTAAALLVGGGATLSLLIEQTLSTLLAPLGFVVVLGGASAYLRRRQGERVEQFVAQLPELARALSNAASAGLAMRTAVALAAEDLANPAGEEMRRVAHAMSVGQALEDALDDLGRRLPARELQVLISTLVISSRAGGSLVSALRNMAETLEARKELRREVRTVLAQSVYTGYMVVALGVGILFLLNTFQPGLLDTMISRPIGQLALAVAGSLFGAGLFLINRVTKIDV